MGIDVSSFLLMAGAMAAGGVGGWVLHDARTAEQRPAPSPPASAPVAEPVPSAVVVVDPEAAAPVCNDSAGAPGDCPSVGPSDESCASIITKRCGEYKVAFKPKVAEQAVACLRRLQGNERCDPVRINLCGHKALMAACPEPLPPAKGRYVRATGTTPATVNLTDDPNTEASPLTSACERIVASCAGQPLGPTLADCRQTLTGMNEAGRASMLACMATQCQQRGLLGCEAVPQAAVSGQVKQ